MKLQLVSIYQNENTGERVSFLTLIAGSTFVGCCMYWGMLWINQSKHLVEPELEARAAAFIGAGISFIIFSFGYYGIVVTHYSAYSNLGDPVDHPMPLEQPRRIPDLNKEPPNRGVLASWRYQQRTGASIDFAQMPRPDNILPDGFWIQITASNRKLVKLNRVQLKLLADRIRRNKFKLTFDICYNQSPIPRKTLVYLRRWMVEEQLASVTTDKQYIMKPSTCLAIVDADNTYPPPTK